MNAEGCGVDRNHAERAATRQDLVMSFKRLQWGVVRKPSAGSVAGMLRPVQRSIMKPDRSEKD